MITGTEESRYIKLAEGRSTADVTTALVAAGASLPEVSQVLRHRSVLSTAIYAKVDRVGLAVLAQPWPGGAA